jgi:PAS domain S-box-containing protein
MNNDEILKIINLCSALWPWLVFVGGGLLILWKQAGHFIRAYCFLLNLYHASNRHNIQIMEELSKLSQGKNESDIRHKLAESKLRIAIYICDIKGSCIYVNDYLAELWGVSHEEMHDFGWLSNIIEEDRLDIYDNWLESVAKQVPYNAEYTIKNSRTHNLIRVKSVAWCVKNVRNEPVCYIGSIDAIDEFV